MPTPRPKRPGRPKPDRRPRRLALDHLETRLALSGSGVDALAMGDVNGDRVADIAVASHRDGHEYVTIYGGNGTPDPSLATGTRPLVLAEIEDPFGAGSGPLSLALGDFAGTGVSQLAVSTVGFSPVGSANPGVQTYSFTVDDARSPVNSAVTPHPMASPILPAGFNPRAGLRLAAGDLTGDGRTDLAIAPATSPGGSISVQQFGGSADGWQQARSIGNIPVARRSGFSLSVGDLTGDGIDDVAVGSRSSGTVGIYDGGRGRWARSRNLLGPAARPVRVAIVAAHGQPGTLVVTADSAAVGQQAAIWTWKTPTQSAIRFSPAVSLGSGPGSLVPLAGGTVYQRSTILASADPSKSAGPIAPTVLFGSTRDDRLVVQGFAASGGPSAADTYVEPLRGDRGQGFVPLMPRSDPASGNAPETTGSAPLPATESVQANLVALPEVHYTSPYAIDLSEGPAGFDRGLLATTPEAAANPDVGAWGPAKTVNAAPAIITPAASTGVSANDVLRMRLLAAYRSVIGVDYQHHHDPTWLPKQGSAWNVTSTVGYQSTGIDCTNLTAWAYANALGIKMNSATPEQAAISPTNPNGTVIPASLAGHAKIVRIDKSQWTGYADLVSKLLPGDILIINGSKDPAQAQLATHGITWLGRYGVDANGHDPDLVIDSTGISLVHVDSNGQVVPEGVRVRPFGPPGSVNDWYFNHVDHVLRLIGP